MSKKLVVTPDNMGVGLVWNETTKKYDVAGGSSNSPDFIQVTNLQNQPVGVGFTPFWGNEKTDTVVLGLPKAANSSASISDPNLDATKPLSTNYRFTGYQIDSGMGVVTQVVQWGNNEWYRRGSGKQPNVTWGKWQRHGYDQGFVPIIDKYKIREGLEYTEIDTVAVKRMSEQLLPEQEMYDDYFAPYENEIWRTIDGVYAGHKVMTDKAVIYVDSVAGNDDNPGTRAAPKKTLEFLSYIPDRQSSIILLKVGGVYNISSGRGRAVQAGAVRVFRAYGDPIQEAFERKYKGSPVVKWWGGFGLGSHAKPILRIPLALHQETGTLLNSVLECRNGGTLILQGLDFDTKLADTTPADLVNRTDSVAMFINNDGGSIVAHFCNFRVNKNAGQEHAVCMLQDKASNSSWKFYNCTLSGDDNRLPATTGFYRGNGQSLLHILDNYGFKSTEQPIAGNLMAKLRANLGAVVSTGSGLTATAVTNNTYIKVE